MKKFIEAIVFIVLGTVVLCFLLYANTKSISSKFDTTGMDSLLVDKTPVSAEKHYNLYVYSDGTNVAEYEIKSWRLGISSDILYCVTMDDKEMIVKGDWIILGE